MNDTNFSFQLNLTGVTAAMGRAKVEEGYYNCTISQCFINRERNVNRVVFKVMFTDEGFHGVIRTTGIQLPGTTEGDVRPFWRSVLESCGYNSTHLDQAIMISPQNFVGRSCKIYFKPKVKDSPAENEQYDKVDFLTHQDWATRKGLFDAKASQQATMPTSAAVQSTPQEVGHSVTLPVASVTLGSPQPLGSFQGADILAPAGTPSVPSNGSGNIATPNAGFGVAPHFSTAQITNMVKPS